MQCEWMLLCQRVEKKVEGMTIVGVIGRLAIDDIPTESAPITVAFRIYGQPNEEFQLQVRLEAPDGSPVLESEVLWARLPLYGIWDSSIAFRPILLDALGRYKFILTANRAVIGEALLTVALFIH